MIKKRKVRIKSLPVQETVEPVIEEAEESVHYDMTGWENDFDYSTMKGLFFIVKGQCGKEFPLVTVKKGSEYYDVHVGSYDPERKDTVNHYCVMDKVTFNCTYGGSSFADALMNIKKQVITYRNSPESYFKTVSDITNEDFYFRHFERSHPFTDSQFKKRAEEGRSWKVSEKMKAHEYALMKRYGYIYEPFVEEAYESAVKELKESSKRIREFSKKGRKKIKLKRTT